MIKKLATYTFVFLYMIAMLRPIAPLVEYIINYDYISEVLCINKDKPELSCKGKCHLMKKLEQQQRDDFNSLTINMKDYPVGFVTILDLSEKKPYPNTIQKKNFFYDKNYHFNFHQEIFHPPTI